MPHSWSTSSGQYSVGSNTPDELRALGRESVERGRRQNDERAVKRGMEYMREADRWDASIEENKRHTSETRRARLHATRAKKDEFRAQYSSTAEERESARKRLAHHRGEGCEWKTINGKAVCVTHAS